MITKDQRERYARHLLLREIGGQGQQKLLTAKVLVVGAGGIGAPLLQYLIAAGVGNITVVDPDTIALSNLQRQVIYGTDDLGMAKTDRVKTFAARLNPDVAITPISQSIDQNNAAALISGHDLVIEGIDNFAGRFVLNKAALDCNVPLLSAAVGRFEGQLSLFKAYADPGKLPCYRCFVPEEPPLDQQIDCAQTGVLGTITGIMGTLAANEAIKEITGIGESLAGRLLLFDGLSSTMRTLGLPADPACPDCQP